MLVTTRGLKVLFGDVASVYISPRVLHGEIRPKERILIDGFTSIRERFMG